MSSTEDLRYWRIRRDLERLEALACFVLATLNASNVFVALFWLFLGVLSAFNVWTWLARRRGE